MLWVCTRADQIIVLGLQQAKFHSLLPCSAKWFQLNEPSSLKVNQEFFNSPARAQCDRDILDNSISRLVFARAGLLLSYMILYGQEVCSKSERRC
jgi:hypothetical protein